MAALDDSPTLRHLLEQAISAQRELMDERFASLRREHDIQAVEIERRLLALNNSHELAVKERAYVVSRDMFEQSQREAEARREILAKDVTLANAKLAKLDGVPSALEDLKTWKGRVEGGWVLIKFGGFCGILAILVSILSFVLRMLGVTAK